MSVRKKNKKKVLMLIFGIVIIVLLIILIVVLAKRKDNNNNKPVNEVTNTTNPVYELPDTTYTGMEVGNISMEYLKDNNETIVNMTFTNNSNRNVEKETLRAYLLNDKGETLGSIPTYIDKLDKGEQYTIEVVFKGDLTSTKQVTLQEGSAEQ